MIYDETLSPLINQCDAGLEDEGEEKEEKEEKEEWEEGDEGDEKE